MIEPGETSARGLPAAVYVAAGLVTALLLLVAGRYGFHRDELYFIEGGRHPAWAQPDNPMLVPLAATAWHDLVGGRLWAFRIPPAVAAGCYVVVAGVIARELGGARAHQVAAAAATALTGIVLAAGHLFSTLVFDMVVTAAALWLLLRALRTDRWRDWIVLGLVTGIALEIKILAAAVLGCCLLGVLLLGPRRRLASVRPWLAVAVAAVIAAPHLVWQAVNDWPMTRIAANIAGGGSASSADRFTVLPLMLLMVGPVIGLVLIIGVIRLLRSDRRARFGWLAAAFCLFLVVVLVGGGKPYYPAAFFPALLAAGAVAVWDWLGRSRARRGALVAAAVSAVVTPVLTLPLAPVGGQVFQIAHAVNPDSAETVGWDGHLRTIASVAASLPPQQRGTTVIITANYGEAGVVARARRLGPPYDALPPVFSGHNAFAAWGPPPETTTAAIVIGDIDADQLRNWFASCEQRATLDSPPGVDNEEDGAPIQLCIGPVEPWATLWPQLTHLS